MKNTIFLRYYPQFLLLIIAFAFFTRTYHLNIPEKYIFDEVYHAVTAKLILDGDTRAYEWNNPPPEPDTAVDWLHPPYAKLTQAGTMAIFGKNSFGWRFSSVIFGCLVVLLTAKISEEIFKDKHIALLSAFLVSLDGLIFTMSRIAMNDIHVTFFILLSIWLYLKFINSKRKTKKFLILSSIAAGFAVGTKWSGVFAIGFIGLVEGMYTLKTFLNSKSKFAKANVHFVLKQAGILLVCCFVIPAILYLGSYSQMFLLGKDFNHLIAMHKNTWWYQTSLEATHPAQSKPIDWFWNTKPVWIAVIYTNTQMRGDIYAVGNPALFWLGNIAIFASLYSLATRKSKKSTSLLGLLIFAYGIVWLPWQLSPRIMFFYHYLPAVPLLAINLSYWLLKLWKPQRYRFFSFLAIVLIFLCFVVLYPHLTLIPVSLEIKEKVYFFFDFWRQA